MPDIDDITEFVRIVELAEGDVIRDGGMRMRLTNRTETQPRGDDDPEVAGFCPMIRFVGEILNIDDITNAATLALAWRAPDGSRRDVPVWGIHGTPKVRFVREIADKRAIPEQRS